MWLRDAISGLELERGDAILDVGSSTRSYRVQTQPHIEANVIAPLRERGIEVRSLDVREDEGVDYVCDLTDPGFDPARDVGRTFPLVLCNNVLLHLSDPVRGVAALHTLVAPGGWLLVSTPERYRRVRDPQDNGLRLPPGALTELITSRAPGGSLEPVREGTVRIDEGHYYRRSIRPSFFRVGSLWVPVPGFVEQLCRAVPALRWRASCVLLRRRAAP